MCCCVVIGHILITRKNRITRLGLLQQGFTAGKSSHGDIFSRSLFQLQLTKKIRNKERLSLSSRPSLHSAAHTRNFARVQFLGQCTSDRAKFTE